MLETGRRVFTSSAFGEKQIRWSTHIPDHKEGVSETGETQVPQDQSKPQEPESNPASLPAPTTPEPSQPQEEWFRTCRTHGWRVKSVVLVEQMITRPDHPAEDAPNDVRTGGDDVKRDAFAVKKGGVRGGAGKGKALASATAAAKGSVVLRKMQLDEDGFLELLFSERWGEGCVLRVLQGQLLDSLLLALSQLLDQRRSIAYSTMAYANICRPLLPCRRGVKAAQASTETKVDTVLVEVECYCLYKDDHHSFLPHPQPPPPPSPPAPSPAPIRATPKHDVRESHSLDLLRVPSWVVREEKRKRKRLATLPNITVSHDHERHRDAPFLDPDFEDKLLALYADQTNDTYSLSQGSWNSIDPREFATGKYLTSGLTEPAALDSPFPSGSDGEDRDRRRKHSKRSRAKSAFRGRRNLSDRGDSLLSDVNSRERLETSRNETDINMSGSAGAGNVSLPDLQTAGGSGTKKHHRSALRAENGKENANSLESDKSHNNHPAALPLTGITGASLQEILAVIAPSLNFAQFDNYEREYGVYDASLDVEKTGTLNKGMAGTGDATPHKAKRRVRKSMHSTREEQTLSRDAHAILQDKLDTWDGKLKYSRVPYLPDCILRGVPPALSHEDCHQQQYHGLRQPLQLARYQESSGFPCLAPPDQFVTPSATLLAQLRQAELVEENGGLGPLLQDGTEPVGEDPHLLPYIPPETSKKKKGSPKKPFTRTSPDSKKAKDAASPHNSKGHHHPPNVGFQPTAWNKILLHTPEPPPPLTLDKARAQQLNRDLDAMNTDCVSAPHPQADRGKKEKKKPPTRKNAERKHTQFEQAEILESGKKDGQLRSKSLLSTRSFSRLKKNRLSCQLRHTPLPRTWTTCPNFAQFWMYLKGTWTPEDEQEVSADLQDSSDEEKMPVSNAPSGHDHHQERLDSKAEQSGMNLQAVPTLVPVIKVSTDSIVGVNKRDSVSPRVNQRRSSTVAKSTSENKEAVLHSQGSKDVTEKDERQIPVGRNKQDSLSAPVSQRRSSTVAEGTSENKETVLHSQESKDVTDEDDRRTPASDSVQTNNNQNSSTGSRLKTPRNTSQSNHNVSALQTDINRNCPVPTNKAETKNVLSSEEAKLKPEVLSPTQNPGIKAGPSINRSAYFSLPPDASPCKTSHDDVSKSGIQELSPKPKKQNNIVNRHLRLNSEERRMRSRTPMTVPHTFRNPYQVRKLPTPTPSASTVQTWQHRLRQFKVREAARLSVASGAAEEEPQSNKETDIFQKLRRYEFSSNRADCTEAREEASKGKKKERLTQKMVSLKNGSPTDTKKKPPAAASQKRTPLADLNKASTISASVKKSSASKRTSHYKSTAGEEKEPPLVLPDRFRVQKLRSAYSFHLLYDHRRESVPEYQAMLAKYQQPFKDKVKPPQKREKTPPQPSAKPSPKFLKVPPTTAKLSSPAAEPPPPVPNLDVKATEGQMDHLESQPEPMEEEQGELEPAVVGKLRDFKFLKNRDYIPQPPQKDSGLQLKDTFTKQDIHHYMVLALEMFQIRKERASSLVGTNSFSTTVSLTFAKPIGSCGWLGVPPWLDSLDPEHRFGPACAESASLESSLPGSFIANGAQIETRASYSSAVV